MKFNLAALRAVVGEKSFIDLINDEDYLHKICLGIKYKEWLDFDTKIANSYEIQKRYDIDELVGTHDPRLSISAQRFKDVAKYTLVDNGDGTFDYEGSRSILRVVNIKFRKIYRCDFSAEGIDSLPESISDSEMIGNCNFSFNNLTNLKNGPLFVGGHYDVSWNKITSLEGAPKHVGGDFICEMNEDLVSLVGAPDTVDGDFNCCQTKITSLDGLSKYIGGSFYCAPGVLTSLQGAPKHVGGNFDCQFNKLTSLKGAPEEVGRDFNCSYNKLTSLDGAPKTVGRDFICYSNSVEFTEEQIRAVCDVRGNVVLEGR